MPNRNIKFKRIRKDLKKLSINSLPITIIILSITLGSIFSDSIPFIKNLNSPAKPLIITFLSIAIGLLIFLIITFLSKKTKNSHIDKGMRSKMMRGERIIDSDKTSDELQAEIKQSKEKIKLEQERLKNAEHTLEAYKKLSKYENDVEKIEI